MRFYTIPFHMILEPISIGFGKNCANAIGMFTISILSKRFTMAKKATTKQPPKTTRKESTIKPSESVETPIVVWIRADIDSLPNDILAKLFAAMGDVLNVPIVSVDVVASRKEII